MKAYILRQFKYRELAVYYWTVDTGKLNLEEKECLLGNFFSSY